MSRSTLFVLLIISLVTSLFPARYVSAQQLTSIEGVVTLDRRFVTIKLYEPGQSLHVTMRFDPQDQQDLRNHSGFFVLDENHLRSVYAGGSPIYNNIAAGTPDMFSPPNELHAIIGQASGEYTVVVYNDTDIPMSFHLSIDNGTFPLEKEEEQPSATQPEEDSIQPDIESREIGTDEVLNETYTVVSGDTLSSIATRLYGDFLYYEELCSYNLIGNCNIIYVDQVLRTPSLSVLTNAAAPAPVAVVTAVSTPVPAPVSAPVSTPVSVRATTGENYTVVVGDTLALIADRFYGDYQRYRELCSFNNLPNCNIISVGQVIRIPNDIRAIGADAAVAVQAQPVAPSPVITPAPAPTPLPAGQPKPVAAQTTPVADPAVAPHVSRPVAAEPTAIPTLVPTDATPASPTETGGTDITSLLGNSSDKSVFLLLWNTAGLADVMKTSGPMTYFVPHDAAFVLALQSNLKSWMDNKQLLSEVLSYHVIAQPFDPTSIGSEPVNLVTLAGSLIEVQRTNGGLLKINGARVIGAPVSGTNGTIYTIEQVLSPPGR